MGKAAINASHSFAVISGTHCEMYSVQSIGERDHWLEHDIIVLNLPFIFFTYTNLLMEQ